MQRIVIRINKNIITGRWYSNYENKIFTVEDFDDDVYIVRGKDEIENKIRFIWKYDTISGIELRKLKLQKIIN